MFYKVRKVKTFDNMELEIEFDNGKVKYYNVKILTEKYDMFKKLLDIDFFYKVKVDIGGYGISWNENIDISCNELWLNSYEKE